MKISIITATYNRAKNLDNLYESILKQSNKNIEWIIIDDGSTDETNEKVKKFIQEKKLEIKYFYQENSGKMQAINNAIKHVTGEFFIECDSDDYLTDDAIKTIIDNIKENKKENVYAYVFLKTYQDFNIIGTKIEKEKKESTMFDLYFKENVEGDKALVFDTDIRKKYFHRIEKNEKFITEARLYNEMDQKHKVIGINKAVLICQYQADGYSQNMEKIYQENPKGFFEYF